VTVCLSRLMWQGLETGARGSLRPTAPVPDPTRSRRHGFFSNQPKPRRADRIARCLFDKKLCCCDRRRSRRRYNGRDGSERSICGMSVMSRSICISVLSRTSSLPSAGPYSRVCAPLPMALFLVTKGISARVFLLRTTGVDSPGPRCLPGSRMRPAISLAVRTQLRAGKKEDDESRTLFKPTKLRVSKREFPRKSPHSSSKERNLWIGEGRIGWPESSTPRVERR